MQVTSWIVPKPEVNRAAHWPSGWMRILRGFCYALLAVTANYGSILLFNSFHEKAGMSQEGFLFLFSLSFLWIPGIRAGPPLSPSFHPHS
jgi:hypothetical protein